MINLISELQQIALEHQRTYQPRRYQSLADKLEEFKIKRGWGEEIIDITTLNDRNQFMAYYETKKYIESIHLMEARYLGFLTWILGSSEEKNSKYPPSCGLFPPWDDIIHSERKGWKYGVAEKLREKLPPRVLEDMNWMENNWPFELTMPLRKPLLKHILRLTEAMPPNEVFERCLFDYEDKFGILWTEVEGYQKERERFFGELCTVRKEYKEGLPKFPPEVHSFRMEKMDRTQRVLDYWSDPLSSYCAEMFGIRATNP